MSDDAPPSPVRTISLRRLDRRLETSSSRKSVKVHHITRSPSADLSGILTLRTELDDHPYDVIQLSEWAAANARINAALLIY